MAESVTASRAKRIASTPAMSAAETRVRLTSPPLATVLAPEDAHHEPTAWVQMESAESATLTIGFHLVAVAVK